MHRPYDRKTEKRWATIMTGDEVEKQEYREKQNNDPKVQKIKKDKGIRDEVRKIVVEKLCAYLGKELVTDEIIRKCISEVKEENLEMLEPYIKIYGEKNIDEVLYNWSIHQTTRIQATSVAYSKNGAFNKKDDSNKTNSENDDNDERDDR
jgi:ribosomal protein L12E/L44/L45/RPP1/RPP2